MKQLFENELTMAQDQINYEVKRLLNTASRLALSRAEEQLNNKAEQIRKLIESDTARQIYYDSLGENFSKLHQKRMELRNKYYTLCDAAFSIYKLSEQYK